MTTPQPARSRVVRIADIVVGLALAVIAAGVGLGLLLFVQQLSGLSATCDGVAADGVRCNGVYLDGMVIAAYTGVVLGWFVPIAIMIMRFTRRQLGFFLPLIAVAVMIVAVYGASAALSAYAGAAAS